VFSEVSGASCIFANTANCRGVATYAALTCAGVDRDEEAAVASVRVGSKSRAARASATLR
jgi:hypothetical protein